jgi:hypothetical protein
MPLVPLLTVVDSADGGSAVATIGGSTPGSMNTVSVNQDGSATWTVAGSRTGDGTVALTLAKGYYWAKCDSVVAAESVVSNVARLPVTDADDSVHLRAAAALQARYAALSMPLLKGIHVHGLPDENVVKFPCVILWFSDPEQILGGTNLRDDVGYPIRVGLMDRKLTALSTVPEWALSYRQRMMRASRFQRLAGVPEIYTTAVSPELVIDEKLPWFDFLVSGFTVMPVSREVRG